MYGKETTTTVSIFPGRIACVTTTESAQKRSSENYLCTSG